jgi:DNA-binding transcriptional MerR regulator
MAGGSYSIQELQAQTGVSTRSLRYWIRLKLVPKPLGRGRGARYDERHLIRVRVIQHLRNQKLSTDAIRARIASRTDAEIAAMVPPAPRAVTPEGVPLPPAAATYPFQTWELVYLMEGLSLMVNPSFGPLVRRIADDIFRHYAMPVGQAKRT